MPSTLSRRDEPQLVFSSSARVRTDRARRYLSQLCKHGGQLAHRSHSGSRGAGHAGAPLVTRAEDAGSEGTIDFAWGSCAMEATADSLILRVQADTEEKLTRLEHGVAARLRQIGRRDGLAVTWQRDGDRETPASPVAPAGTRAACTPESIAEGLLSAAGRADPYPLYAAAHAVGPVSVISAGWYLVAGYSAASEVLRSPGFGLPGQAATGHSDADPSETAALRVLSQSILRANPPDHARMRSPIAQVFTPRRVAGLGPAIGRVTGQLLDRLGRSGAGGATVDLMDAFAFQLPVTVICELLGIPAADRGQFRPLASDLTEALELSADSSAAAASAASELARYFTGLIAERRAAPGDDLISALVRVRDAGDGRISEQELLGNLMMLLVAGFETTTNLLGNGMALLLQRPGLVAALRHDPAAIPGFIEEVLRYDSPVQVTTRIARADGLTISGMPVPPGSQVLVLIGAANRDPARYPDPGRFDPWRTDIKPLSFGAGAHVCIGNALARLEASIAFTALLSRFPDLSAAPGGQPRRRDRLVLRGFQTLPVTLTAPVPS